MKHNSKVSDKQKESPGQTRATLYNSGEYIIRK